MGYASMLTRREYSEGMVAVLQTVTGRHRTQQTSDTGVAHTEIML